MNGLTKAARSRRIGMVALLIAQLALPGLASAAPSRLGFYGEVLLSSGRIWGEEEAANGHVRDADASLAISRFSVGGVFGGRVRVGAVVDVFHQVAPSDWGAALGIETLVDRRLISSWRIGLRVSGALGQGNRSPAVGSGQIIMAGVRASSSSVVFAIDGMFVRYGANGDRSHGNGIVAGVGVTGRPGKYAIGVSAAGAVVTGIILAAIMSQAMTH